MHSNSSLIRVISSNKQQKLVRLRLESRDTLQQQGTQVMARKFVHKLHGSRQKTIDMSAVFCLAVF